VFLTTMVRLGFSMLPVLEDPPESREDHPVWAVLQPYHLLDFHQQPFEATARSISAETFVSSGQSDALTLTFVESASVLRIDQT
jgi:hypothetical protein